MQVKKFEAPTIQEALENVKRELGPEAIILQTKNNKKGFGFLSKSSVEVTAAISDRSMDKKSKVENRLRDSDKDIIKRLPAEKQARLYDKYVDKTIEKARATQERVELARKPEPVSTPEVVGKRITATRYIDILDDKLSLADVPIQKNRNNFEKPKPPRQIEEARSGLEEEVKQLREMLQDLQKATSDSRTQEESQEALARQISLDIPTLQDVFEQLVVNGVDRRYALSLIKKAAFSLGPIKSKEIDTVMDAVANELLETIAIQSPLELIQSGQGLSKGKGPAVISFIGPTGVGKTTTLAKIASEAQLKLHLKVGLINLDYYKITAFDQLATYGKILHVPFRSVASIDDLKIALQDFQNLDLVLVDTTGRSHRDPQSLKEIQELLSAVPNLATFLVLSATTRDSELFDAAGRFSVFNPKGLIISKLDEVMVYGGIYNLSQRVRLPLVYFTTGQKVPDDIENATRERLVSLLMGF